AGLVVQRAAQAVDERRFARAVRPDEAKPLARADREIDVLQRDKPAEPLAEAGDGQDGLPVHSAACRANAAASNRAARRRCRAEINPMIPFGATITNPISNNPTISRLSADEMVTVASCWIVPNRIEPITGPIHLVMPPITGIATLLTA